MKLTIITPSYNQGNFIHKTFESIINQKKNFELEYIVVDGLSTDKTKDIVEEYREKFLKKGIHFTFICEKDNGQSDAINKGLRLASGDIVTYLNSDDYYEEDCLQKVIDFFSGNRESKWVFGGGNLVSENGKIFKSISVPKYNFKKLLKFNFIIQPSVFFRRELLNEVGFLDENLHLSMDYDLWLRIGSKYSANTINVIISNARFHSNAKTSAYIFQQHKEAYELSKKYSKRYSIERFEQFFFYFLKMLISSIKMDASCRINRMK